MFLSLSILLMSINVFHDWIYKLLLSNTLKPHQWLFIILLISKRAIAIEAMLLTHVESIEIPRRRGKIFFCTLHVDIVI